MADKEASGTIQAVLQALFDTVGAVIKLVRSRNLENATFEANCTHIQMLCTRLKKERHRLKAYPDALWVLEGRVIAATTFLKSLLSSMHNSKVPKELDNNMKETNKRLDKYITSLESAILAFSDIDPSGEGASPSGTEEVDEAYNFITQFISEVTSILKSTGSQDAKS